MHIMVDTFLNIFTRIVIEAFLIALMAMLWAHDLSPRTQLLFSVVNAHFELCLFYFLTGVVNIVENKLT